MVRSPLLEISAMGGGASVAAFDCSLGGYAFGFVALLPNSTRAGDGDTAWRKSCFFHAEQVTHRGLPALRLDAASAQEHRAAGASLRPQAAQAETCLGRIA